MLNADVLLALLQWVLIAIGFAISLGSAMVFFFPGEVSTYVYTYPDGRIVEASAKGGGSSVLVVTSSLMGFAIGLVTMAAGAVLFCLRRIGNFMGQLRDEMRQIEREER